MNSKMKQLGNRRKKKWKCWLANMETRKNKKTYGNFFSKLIIKAHMAKKKKPTQKFMCV